MTGETGTDQKNFQIQDADEFARNMTRLTEASTQALTLMLAPKGDGEARSIFADEAAIASKTLGEVAEKFLANPQRAAQAQNELWRGFLDLWTETLRRATGEHSQEVIEPPPGDK
ncbi:MAG: hypothetical protein AB7L41_16740, partial [Flavobacteriaceae bacterium]